MWLCVLDDAAGDLQETQTDRGELCVPQQIATRDCGTQVEQQPVGTGVQDEPHLVGQRRAAAGAIGRELCLVLLDQVLGRSAAAIPTAMMSRLRRDAAFKLACGRLPDTGRDLCSQPTISRWEKRRAHAAGDHLRTSTPDGAQYIRDRVRNARRIAPVGNVRSERVGDIASAIRKRQQHHATIGGQPASIESGCDFLARNAW